MTTDAVLDRLKELYPDAGCELVYRNNYELLIAVILSAQTTDAAVNNVTPALFRAYPDAASLAKADVMDVASIIRTIGLYKSKARHLVACAQELVNTYHGQVPDQFDQLIQLSGVGRKTANVVLSVGFQQPALAVDTHVARVAKRLGWADAEDDVFTIEKKLKRRIKKKRWSEAHHLMLFFGRYRCTARNKEPIDVLLARPADPEHMISYRKPR